MHPHDCVLAFSFAKWGDAFWDIPVSYSRMGCVLISLLNYLYVLGSEVGLPASKPIFVVAALFAFGFFIAELDTIVQKSRH